MMRLNNEICISFLQGSGWLENHDETLITRAKEASIHIGNVLCPRCNAVAFDVDDEIPKWMNQGYCWCCGQKMKWKTSDE